MIIDKYVDYFHDGNILNIQHVCDNIILTMKSAEIDPGEIEDINLLSKDSRLKGKLHINNINGITIDKKPYYGFLQKTHDKIEILDMSVKDGKLELFVESRSFPYKQDLTENSLIEIAASKIYWENIPGLMVILLFFKLIQGLMLPMNMFQV